MKVSICLALLISAVSVASAAPAAQGDLLKIHEVHSRIEWCKKHPHACLPVDVAEAGKENVDAVEVQVESLKARKIEDNIQPNFPPWCQRDPACVAQCEKKPYLKICLWLP
jgi:hypothetical protein